MCAASVNFLLRPTEMNTLWNFCRLNLNYTEKMFKLTTTATANNVSSKSTVVDATDDGVAAGMPDGTPE
jgi:hypothetical protein